MFADFAVFSQLLQGLEVKFPAKEITFGSDNAILLDGALSADLDHRAGAALSYDWICETVEGRPCYVLQAAGQLLKERCAIDEAIFDPQLELP